MWDQVFDGSSRRILHRDELLAAGATARGLTAAVRGGFLLRVRRDHYALPGTDRHLLQAVRVGGRLDCVSALRDFGVFGFDQEFPHIHMLADASRLRSPNDRRIPLTAANRAGARLHWHPLIDNDAANEYRVGILDALAQSLRCQQPSHAVASLDSALHLGLLSTPDLALIFANAPERVQHLRALLDPRSESGQESVLRMIVSSAGLGYKLQVQIPRVGRVDIVVEGCLVLEADSRLAHDGWEMHVRDRNRDIDAARAGYMSLRPVYNRIMFAPDEVREAILELLLSDRIVRIRST